MHAATKWTLALALVWFGCLAPSPAAAYLDPGSGSYFFQIIIAGLVAGLFALKMFWVRVSTFFGSLVGRGSNPKQRDDS